MSIRSTLARATGLVLLCILPSLAQTPPPTDEEKNLQAYIGFLRSDVKKVKTQVISEVLQLDAAQAAKFWPIYKEFETELAKVGDGIEMLVKDYIANYERMTPEVSERLAAKLLSLEQQRLDLKKRYHARVRDGVDAVTATRFLLVENQLEKLLDLQLASRLPAMN
jgi:hypothetical protein